ncbi:hypothetical protein tb265_40560 [Gemmatimonadetes bacterium T265]|nr:hypothetical protein tb265_39680 [Gemmatimonadetes bacterium T265]GJG88875.1 hypothetical protein tb265_40560 [Gemmatimonadetes bacterium T265]
MDGYEQMTDDQDEIETEILDALASAADARRPYAGFFSWPDPDVAERGVAADFAAAAAGVEPGLPWDELRSRGRGNDPPDCEAVDSTGRRIAIEITEIVDGRPIAAATATRRPQERLWAIWKRERFLQEAQRRLTEKDGKVLKDGPYDEYIVIIHTDEPTLDAERVGEWLTDHRFDQPRQLSRAYLLLSYDPRPASYPYFKLSW